MSRLAPLAGLLLLLLVPLAADTPYLRHLFIMAFIWGIVAASWSLTLGFGGIFNFAHLAFFGLGVYAAGIAAKTLALNPWAALLAGPAVAAAAAAFVSLPVLRLKGIYVILVTFAFSQLALQLILSQSDVTGGAQGMVMVPTLSLPDHNFLRDRRLGYYFVGLGLLVVTILILRAIVRSPFGLGLVAIRDNEEYAAARGISVARHRILAMVASGALAGLAGAYYAIYLRVASPEVFGFGIMSVVLSMVLVGGAATLYGPVLAAFLLSFATESMVTLGAWRYIIVSALMILVLRFAPGGIASIAVRLRPPPPPADGGPENARAPAAP